MIRVCRASLPGHRMFSYFAVVGCVVGGGLVWLPSVADAQTFSPIGPRYPGEVIISERVITPRADPVPAPRQGSPAAPQSRNRSHPNTSIAGDEPMSLSDGGFKPDRALADQPPLFALGREVWEQMLKLERENAELQANLDYERKLATYFEHNQNIQRDLQLEIATLRQEIEALQKESSESISRAASSVVDLTEQNTRYQKEIGELRRALAKKMEPQPSQTAQPEIPKSKPIRTAQAEAEIADRRDREQSAVETKMPTQLPTPRQLPKPTQLAEPTDTPMPASSKTPAPDESDSSMKATAPKKDHLTEDRQEVTFVVVPIGFQIVDELVTPGEPSATAPIPLVGEARLKGETHGPVGRTIED